MAMTNTATKTFIETQFPVAKLSRESYKERRSNYSQTLTGLGKWWGRKPLILVRAALLGLLMPSSNDPKSDRQIFLKLLMMDDDGLSKRKTKSIPLAVAYEFCTPRERSEWFDASTTGSPRMRKGALAKDRQHIQQTVFERLPYERKLEYCDRPEQTDGLSKTAWSEINSHLGTHAHTFEQLVAQLGEREFGRIPLIGDAFSGGGSVPFEASRVGCHAYGSDLSPLAALLSWAAIKVVGGGASFASRLLDLQKQVFSEVDKKICDLGVEHNELGWRADYFLYCNEVRCPECSWKVPLAPSWIIAAKYGVVAILKPNQQSCSFDFDIRTGVGSEELASAKRAGTLKDSKLLCPHCSQSTPIAAVRGDRRKDGETQLGLRMWDNEDLVPQQEDTFHERLYCIRWIESSSKDGNDDSQRHYTAPSVRDLERERTVLRFLHDRIESWQTQGLMPSRRIEPGEETTRLQRERGWTFWHHLFNPRQLLLQGLMLEQIESMKNLAPAEHVGLLLRVGSCLNWNSRLCIWNSDVSKGGGSTEQTFVNQALNTQYNYGVRAVTTIERTFFGEELNSCQCAQAIVEPLDARAVTTTCDLWITDPPYADAVSYHELSEFFLAWYEKHIPKIFPNWYTDSKRALAIVGREQGFRQSMAQCYRNLIDRTSPDGAQIVMFTHQDSSVWADLALILWSAGLRVTAAWCVVTETDSGLKEGNYVQGTVILIVRRQTSESTAFLDELYPRVEAEVKAQLDEMLSLEDQHDPNFSDTDYQLAAYAAALRVLTQYKTIEDIDVGYELAKQRRKGEESPIERIIVDAVKVACDHLVPKGFDTFIWKQLTPSERFYLKGLDLQSHGELRSGAYQELARGFGIREYKPLLFTGKANETRLKTACEFAARSLDDAGFGASLVRNCLFAIREVVRSSEVQQGRNWLRSELSDYWTKRKTILEILRYLSSMSVKTPSWQEDGEAARLLVGAVENDHA